MISLGLDRRWRTRRSPPSACPPDRACSTSPAAPATSADELAGIGYRAVGIDLSAGMLARAHVDAPLVRGDAAALPLPDGGVRRHHLRLCAPQLRRARRRVRGCAACCARGGRFAPLDATVPRNPSSARATRSGSAARCPCSVGCRPDADAYRYLPVDGVPPAGRRSPPARGSRLQRRARTTLTGGSVLLLTGTRMTGTRRPPACARSPARSTPPSTPRRGRCRGLRVAARRLAIVTGGRRSARRCRRVARRSRDRARRRRRCPRHRPVAVGALPFDPDAPGGSSSRRRRRATRRPPWITELAPGRRGGPRRCRRRASPSTRPHAAAVARVVHARARRDRRRCSREGRARTRGGRRGRRALRRAAIVARLAPQQPGCFVYASDGLVGASPELLVRRIGDTSSRARSPAPPSRRRRGIARALPSRKDQREHRLRRRRPRRRARRCARAGRRPVPRSRFPRRRPPRHPVPRPPPRAGADRARLTRRLHPTPAVGGTPAGRARAHRTLEGFDRGRYAGPVGWVDARGDGEWAIALRGAELDGARARSSRVPASSPAPTPTPSGPRPRRSSSPCSARSSVPDPPAPLWRQGAVMAAASDTSSDQTIAAATAAQTSRWRATLSARSVRTRTMRTPPAATRHRSPRATTSSALSTSIDRRRRARARAQRGRRPAACRTASRSARAGRPAEGTRRSRRRRCRRRRTWRRRRGRAHRAAR